MNNLQILMMNSGGLGYGYLYNWYAANDANFAPTDWRLPTDIEMGAYLSGHDLTLKEVGSIHWTTANGTNTTGFTALGSGLRSSAGTFSGIKTSFRFWNDEDTASNAFYANLNDSDGSFTFSLSASKKSGFAVRLIYTGGGTPTTVTDNDGNVYDVVNIDGAYFTVQNWKCTTLSKSPFTALTKVTDSTAWGALTTEGYCAYDNNESNV